MKYDRKRQEAAVRESLRWEQMQGVQEAEAARVQFNRDAGLKAASNKSSEHFNIISLEYHPTREGQQLRYKVRGGAPCTCAPGMLTGVPEGLCVAELLASVHAARAHR
jgi:hypothetical protein